MKASVLVVDDEENLRKLLSRVVELEGYAVAQAASVKEALKVLQHDVFQVVISDVKLPDGNGIDLTARIKKEYPGVEVIVLTAYGTIEDGVKAIKNGAFDYLTKGDHQERIIPLLSKAAEKAMLQQKVLTLGTYLSHKAVNSSLSSWSVLTLLQKIINDKSLSEDDQSELKTKLYALTGTGLPGNLPGKSYSSEKRLEKAFWKNLQ